MPNINDVKNDLFKHYNEKYGSKSKQFVNKLNKFDDVWDRANLVADILFSGNTNKSREKIVEDLVREYFDYKGSVLKSFRNISSRTLEENVERAIRLSTVRRLQEFIDKYSFDKKGNPYKLKYKYSFDGKKLSLNQWAKRYLQNKISTVKFLEIIQFYQTKIPKYDVKNYRKSDSSTSTLRKYGLE